jgi:hypothetical protein
MSKSAKTLSKLATRWLELNDPTWVSAAQKATETRRTPYSNEALECIIGSGCKGNGRELDVKVVYEGGNLDSGLTGNVTVPQAASQEREIDEARFTTTHRRGGDRGGCQRRSRAAKRAAKRARLMSY